MSHVSHRIIRLEETGSTNSEAMRGAIEGEPLPFWMVARRQTEGRGRSGRTWVSAPGNLNATGAYAIVAPLRSAGQLSLVAGVALMNAIEVVAPQARSGGLRLKWPNDVLLGGAKVAGILVESTTRAGSPGFAAIFGFGVNVASVPDGLDVAATALSVLRADGAECVLMALTAALDRRLADWDGGAGFDRIRQAWIERAGALGEPLSVRTPDGRIGGQYRGLSESGALLIEVEGCIREINFGDVALAPPAQAGGS